MNLFDAGEYAWDDVGANAFSKPFGASGHVYGPRETCSATAKVGRSRQSCRPRRGACRPSKGEGYSVRHSASLGEDMIYYCRKLSDGDKVYLVRLAVSGASEWQMFAKVLPTIVWVLLLDFLVCLLLRTSRRNTSSIPSENSPKTPPSIHPFHKIFRAAANRGYFEQPQPRSERAV
ncbi:MAG: hypothetical protein ACLRSW_00340 [Christensenellaceae bacterium]